MFEKVNFFVFLFVFLLQLCFPIFRSKNSTYWRRRSNCFTNFYSLLFYLLRKRREIKKRRSRYLQSSMSVTSNNRGHHHASDFIYASPYELIEKHADPNYGNSDIYVPASVSIRMTPPPLPQRNNNYSPPPRNKDRISSRSSSSTPPVTRAFPKTPSPINNDLKVLISNLDSDSVRIVPIFVCKKTLILVQNLHFTHKTHLKGGFI